MSNFAEYREYTMHCPLQTVREEGGQTGGGVTEHRENLSN